jgi:hypothetical protein
VSSGFRYRRKKRRSSVKVKRLATSAIALVGLMVGLTSTIAEAADGLPLVETSHASFVLTSATCPNLPVGTTINGSGTQTSITTRRTDRSGVTTLRNSTITNGTATDDQKKNTYVFHYANQFRISNSLAHPNVVSGTMTDIFSLAGPGPARLRNGFAAEFTTKEDLSFVFSWKVHRAFGDPISFAPGPFDAHCDPR